MSQDKEMSGRSPRPTGRASCAAARGFCQLWVCVQPFESLRSGPCPALPCCRGREAAGAAAVPYLVCLLLSLRDVGLLLRPNDEMILLVLELDGCMMHGLL